MRYYLLGDEWKGRESVEVEVKKTPKSITIAPISKKPLFTNGCIDQLWDKGKIVIREPAPESHKICRHKLNNWGDGIYTLYPDRAGLPYVLIPKDSKYAQKEKE